MAERYVLDAFALLALVGDEAGGDQVASILQDASAEVFMSAINLGEVYYILRRRRGEAAAREVESRAFRQPNLRVVEPTSDRIRAAAEIKAVGGISFADAFAAALAQELSAILLTGDSEFEPLARSGALQVVWLGRT